MTYRTSHIAKSGTVYDQQLENGGLSEFLSQREREILISLLNRNLIPKQGRYLDFACGSGRILSVLSPHFNEVVAVDISSVMAEKARELVPSAQYHIVDITEEALDVGGFDLISAFRFFGNAEDELRIKVLRRLRSMISKDGRFIFNNHRNPGSTLSICSGNRQGMDLSVTKMRSLVEENGFRIDTIYPIGAWIWRHRWCEKRVWSSYPGKVMEKLAANSALSKFAADMVVIARPV